jgi:SsrA-binding protein
LEERLECGIMLKGSEVKSLRTGQANLEGAYARILNGEIWLYGCDIPEYTMANQLNHEPKRARKLLLHKNEIAKFAEKSEQRGLTLIPTKMYFKEGKAKVEIAIGKGKKLQDKIKRGVLKPEDLAAEAEELMNEFQSHPAFAEMMKAFKSAFSFEDPAAARASGRDNDSRLAIAKARLRAKLEAKRGGGGKK